MSEQPETAPEVGIFPAEERPALVFYYLDRTEVCLRHRYGFWINNDATRAWRVLDSRGRAAEQLVDFSGKELASRGYYLDRRQALQALLAFMQLRLEVIGARRELVERELGQQAVAPEEVSVG